MATARRLYPGEEQTCHYCQERIKSAHENDDTWVVEIGDPERVWHAECADSIGVPIEYEAEEEEEDPDFDYDPDLDGPREDED